MERTMQKSSLKLIFERIKSYIDEIDVEDDENKSYEKTNEFETLSQTNKNELEKAFKSINEDEVNYGKTLKEEQKREKLNIKQVAKKAEKEPAKKISEKDKKIADYYSQEPKKKSKKKDKDRDD